MEDEKLLTAPELAHALGICIDSVYRNAERGRFPLYKIGGVFRFKLSEVLAATRDKTQTEGENENAD